MGDEEFDFESFEERARDAATELERLTPSVFIATDGELLVQSGDQIRVLDATATRSVAMELSVMIRTDDEKGWRRVLSEGSVGDLEVELTLALLNTYLLRRGSNFEISLVHRRIAKFIMVARRLDVIEQPGSSIPPEIGLEVTAGETEDHE